MEPLLFSDIYEQYYTKILRYLARLIDQQEAEELAQITFEKINRGLGSFKGESKLSTWIYRIATNTAIDRLKSSQYKHSHSAQQTLLDLDEPGTESTISEHTDTPRSTDENIIRGEMSECIREFIYKLPPDYRTVIILNELEGFANKEISQILQISLETTKIRLHRARTKLKKSLESSCDFYHDYNSGLACDRKQPTDKN